jgi:predicted HAD superfamily Cof-like phosphohydrolase
MSETTRAKSPHQQRVEKFMGLAKQYIPDSPIVPDAKTRELRAKLILEEALETIKGLGFTPIWNPELFEQPAYIFKEDILFYPNDSVSLKEIVDGCADIIVITTGTLSACGVSDVSVQEAVDNNNLAKFGPGHSYRADGKLIKPPDHKHPDIEGLLKKQEEECKSHQS